MQGFTTGKMVFTVAGAVTFFILAYSLPGGGPLMIGYLYCVLLLSHAPTVRQAFYSGLVTGMVSVAPLLSFFWTVFGPAAGFLWAILGFWIGLFVALTRSCRIRFGTRWALALAPILWTGLEYFRSELYYLRFTWMNAGYAFSGNLPSGVFHFAGMYGIGFVLMTLAAAASLPRSALARLASLAVIVFALRAIQITVTQPSPEPLDSSSTGVRVAGLQLEFPTEDEVLVALNDLDRRQPDAELIVLSEYTFLDVVPPRIKRWCASHRKYLIVGGEDPAPNSNFYNTAFVIDPRGEVVFRQVKSVPIQFFKDGLPAPRQAVWQSPWGPIGICICYDLSYTHVTDSLIRLGAHALIVPTMDVTDWGRRQHKLHARVAPVRAAEYGVPIFRVGSSGLSQWVDRGGQVVAQAGFPGQREIITGRLDLSRPGSLPLDRWLGPLATGLTGLCLAYCLFSSVATVSRTSRPESAPISV